MAFPRHGIPYTELFYRALEGQNILVTEGQISGRWLLRHLRGFDFVHFHWPSFFHAGRTRRESLRGFAFFLFLLALARWRGARVIWTVHNLYPHDTCAVPRLDRWTRKALVREGVMFFVHGPAAAAIVEREFPAARGRTRVIDHGHFRGYYPDHLSRSAARRRLGLADAEYTFLFLGLCKPYKNVHELVAVFGRLPGRPVLVIAGRFQDRAYEARVRAAAAASSARILLRAGFVPNEEVQMYLRSCDAVVIPYRDILTSGTALLALSFGRPVIAPSLGCLPEVVTPPCGILYNPTEPDGLLGAMERALVATFEEAEIERQALAHDWAGTGRTFARYLRDELGPAGGA